MKFFFGRFIIWLWNVQKNKDESARCRCLFGIDRGRLCCSESKRGNVEASCDAMSNWRRRIWWRLGTDVESSAAEFTSWTLHDDLRSWESWNRKLTPNRSWASIDVFFSLRSKAERLANQHLLKSANKWSRTIPHWSHLFLNWPMNVNLQFQEKVVAKLDPLSENACELEWPSETSNSISFNLLYLIMQN